MTIDVASKKFGFAFAPHCSGTLSPSNQIMGKERFLQTLGEEVSDIVAGSTALVAGESLCNIVSEFPALFSPTVGMANCAP
jgi:hypothetical protein